MKGKFVPWLYAVGSKIRQVSLGEMALDASLMASAVIDSAKLFNSPVVCVNFDPTLWGEAAGCSVDWDRSPPWVAPGGSADPNPDLVRDSVRIANLVQAIERVKGAMPAHPLACAVAGPATMARLLEIDDPPSRMDQFTVGELITEFVNVLCENKIANVVIVESAEIGDDQLAPWVDGDHYSRIARLADHYSVETTLLCTQASLNNTQVQEFDSLTYVVGRADRTIAADLANAVKGVAVEGFGTGSVRIPSGTDALQQGSYFLTTPWDLGPECDFTKIQQDIAKVASFLDSGN